jgi:hypothetical protein
VWFICDLPKFFRREFVRARCAPGKLSRNQSPSGFARLRRNSGWIQADWRLCNASHKIEQRVEEDMRGRWAMMASEIISLALLIVVSAVVLTPSVIGGPPQQANAAVGDPQSANAAVGASAAIGNRLSAVGAAVTPASATAPAAAPMGTSDVVLVTTAPPRIVRDGAPLQCAIYARQRTNISLSGAARVWWDQAATRYRRSHKPEAGAVMAMGGTPSGHVAVVSRVVNAREILIDHANWMGGGEIILGAAAYDVSPANDWTQVRVWHPPTNSLGLRPYPVQGFIHPR